MEPLEPPGTNGDVPPARKRGGGHHRRFHTRGRRSGLHRLGAALHFLGGGLGIIALGLSVRRAFGWVSIAIGIAVVAATFALSQGGTGAQQIGATERVAAHGIAGWMFVIGVWLYSQTKSRPSSPL